MIRNLRKEFLQTINARQHLFTAFLISHNVHLDLFVVSKISHEMQGGYPEVFLVSRETL